MANSVETIAAPSRASRGLKDRSKAKKSIRRDTAGSACKHKSVSIGKGITFLDDGSAWVGSG